MVSSFHPHSMCEKVERVTTKTGCTSCTKQTISFEVWGFNTETRVLQRDFIQNAPFKAKSSIYNPFWLHLVFFMHLLIILSYKTMKSKSIWNGLWKGYKFAWYHHFTHIACARKLRGLRQKLDALRVQNRQSLSKYEGLIRKLVCYKGISFFFQLISTPLFFCVQNAPFKATSSIFKPLWLYFVFFMHVLIFLSLILKSTTNEFSKGWKLAWFHHYTHIACVKKLRGLRQKLDALRVQNGQSLSKYQDFIRKLVCYKGISFFKPYLNSWLFVCSKCTIQSHIINFQPFLTSFVIFHAFTDYFEL